MQCQVKDAVPLNCTCNHFRASNARARAPARRARKSEAYQRCATAAMEESNTKANLINSSSQSPMRRKEVERRQLSGRRCIFEDFRTTFWEEMDWVENTHIHHTVAKRRIILFGGENRCICALRNCFGGVTVPVNKNRYDTPCLSGNVDLKINYNGKSCKSCKMICVGPS